MIRIINSSSKMACSLLENLLYWGKSQNSTIPFRPSRLNISDLIKEVTDFHEVSAKLKNIMIINDVIQDLFIFADHDMITTILRNLISNAIKFTPKNGEIRITSSVDANMGLIAITDSGLGISKAQLAKLFRSDKEITKGTSGESGTGLGLMLCKEFAVKNGGDILVKSEQRKGSSFILSLPLPPENLNP
jgi:two-component system, sensor histidine kinase and response regulator